MKSTQLLLLSGICLAATFFTLSCDNRISSSSDSTTEIESIEKKSNTSHAPGGTASCKSAGDTGQTALYVNQSVKNATINFTNHDCDIAIYFDENAPENAMVQNTTIIQETGNSGEKTGIWNQGGNVTVHHSAFSTDFAGQYIPIRFEDGARGMVSMNKVTGNHRVAIVVRGALTEVTIKGNTIAGSGPKKGDWAENGIQVDGEATAAIINNDISGHWWDGDSNFASSAVSMLGASNSRVTNNTFQNNEVSIVLFGTGNKVTGNSTSSQIVSQSEFDFKAYGAWIGGSDNHLAGNTFSSPPGTGAVGIYIFPGSPNARVTGNHVHGFTTAIFDGTGDAMIKGTPTPLQGI
ncbi:right-handed parallel beta-helix repeat-containing protein [Fodinibius sediminis]|uniref:Parallel beta-helix repeat (Two copies) n=1 Tax=Fodinibius sediminis TaxID=1214077 RepID=A0A521CLU4_9BACT|nr:right-handed parallel beta-helix repeat-containing protein [Fodinibius sediminis]SMO60427.1 parallel beta-helix repeat (two copies) [Fodinibius sediminis]